MLDVSGYGATVGMLGVEFRRACDSVLYKLSEKKTFRFFCGGDVVHTRKHLVDTFFWDTLHSCCLYLESNCASVLVRVWFCLHIDVPLRLGADDDM